MAQPCFLAVARPGLSLATKNVKTPAQTGGMFQDSGLTRLHIQLLQTKNPLQRRFLAGWVRNLDYPFQPAILAIIHQKAFPLL